MHAQKKLNLTLLNTALASSVRVSSDRRSEDIRTNSALEIATSEPEPIAMPTSAIESAGASFIPSPTMATTARLEFREFLPWKRRPQRVRGRLGRVFWRMEILSA